MLSTGHSIRTRLCLFVACKGSCQYYLCQTSKQTPQTRPCMPLTGHSTKTRLCLLVACKGQLLPLLHVTDLDQLFSCWRRCRLHSRHTHFLIPLEAPADNKNNGDCNHWMQWCVSSGKALCARLVWGCVGSKRQGELCKPYHAPKRVKPVTFVCGSAACQLNLCLRKCSLLGDLARRT